MLDHPGLAGAGDVSECGLAEAGGVAGWVGGGEFLDGLSLGDRLVLLRAWGAGKRTGDLLLLVIELKHHGMLFRLVNGVSDDFGVSLCDLAADCGISVFSLGKGQEHRVITFFSTSLLGHDLLLKLAIHREEIGFLGR